MIDGLTDEDTNTDRQQSDSIGVLCHGTLTISILNISFIHALQKILFTYKIV